MSDDRAAVRSEAGTCFVVEAGAGTGKTTTLIERLVGLLQAGRVTLDRVAAITFTEKAAGELKVRLRLALLEAGADDALAGLELAAITTIHSFCTKILKEHPFAAGLDPRFSVADGPTARLLFEETLEEWLAANLAEPPDGIAAAVRAGMLPGKLRELAHELRKRPDCPELPEPLPADPAGFLRDARAALAVIEAAAQQCPDPNDRAAVAARTLVADCTAAGDDPEAIAQAAMALSNPAKLGAKGKWKKAVAVLEQELRPELARLQEIATAFQEAVDGGRLLAVLHDLRGALAAYAEAKRRRALLDFDDLLLRTRDLLVGRPDVCAEVARQFPVILVDEVQDTDPMQAEVIQALLEAPRGPDAPDAAPVLLVGDPKQSLYRFRRADITLYNALAEVVANRSDGRRARLTETFRNVPRLAEWVNRVCERVFASGPQPPLQAPWVALESKVDPPADAPPPVVILQATPDGEGDEAEGAAAMPAAVDDRRALEAWRLAECLRDAVEGAQPWQVRDTEPPYAPRDLRYADVAVLFRSLSAVEIYEEAFRAAGVPFAVAGGKLFFLRAEVQALTSLAVAIDDPGNRVAVAAFLKGPFTGCSDDDLFRHSRSGRLDPLAPGDGPCREPLALLGELHRRRNARPVAATLLDALDRLRAWGLLRSLRNGAHRVANVEKLIDLARTQEQGGLLTFRGFTQYLQRFSVERVAAEPDSSLPEQGGNAVQLMTVHASKGLEFPVVALADLGPGKHTESTHVIAQRASRSLEVRLKVGARYWATPGAAEAIRHEAEHAAAEERRGFYVACTRAKDRLVIPRVPQAKGATGYNAFLEAAGDAVTEDAEVRIVRPLRPGEVPEPPPPLRPQWDEASDHPVAAARAGWAAGLTELLGTAPPPAGRPVPAAEEAGPAVAIGRAVHHVLETIDLSSPGSLAEPCGAAAAAEGRAELAGEVQAIVERALAMDITRRAAASPRLRRELPLFVEVAAEGGTRLAERRPDLLFEDDGGGLVIVDWKTDTAVHEESLERYRAQLQGYAAALRELGCTVAGACLAYVRLGETREIDLDPV